LKALSLKDQRFPSILGYLIWETRAGSAGAGFSIPDATKLAAAVPKTVTVA
jgi:hypothetical protein